MIPKTIHHVWVGNPMPDMQRACIESWRATNPDYEIKLWHEGNLDFSFPLLSRAYSERKWAKVADIARLLAVLRHGGIYLDTDVRLLRRLDPLLDHHCFFGFQTERPSLDWVANGVMGAVPNHWFLARMLTTMQRLRSLPGLERPTSFGPKLVTRLLVGEGLDPKAPPGSYADGAQVKDVRVHPTRYFFPYAYGEEFDPARVTEETYGIHFWEKSWEKDVPRWLRLARSARARAKQALASAGKPKGGLRDPAG